MGIVRPFQVYDTPAVADLFWRVFRHRQTPSPLSLHSYFRTLYFSNPSYDISLSSLVFEDQKGKVRGFIGGIPLRMRYRDKKIWALAAANHMVDPDLKDPIAGALLLRKFLAGPQDLTFSDTANRISINLWKTLGASTLISYSMRWIRILQPTQFLLWILKRNPLGKVFSFFANPLSLLADIAGARIINRSVEKQVINLRQNELATSTLKNTLQEFMGNRVLLPDYDEEDLDWRLSLAAEKQELGYLYKIGVFERGKLLGWYLFYARKGSIAQVLQIVAHKKTMSCVLNHLFASALHKGCLAVMGTSDPIFITDYLHNNCYTFVRGALTVAHSQNPEILHDMLQGDAFISRLEGDWWTRLDGGDFL